MTEVAVDEVVVDPEVYPRENTNPELIERYRLNLDALPAIIINQEYLLIDGMHRLFAHRQEGRDTIKAEIWGVPRSQVLVEAARLNAKHGEQLSTKEKQHLALLWMDQYTDEETAEILSTTRRTITNWREDARSVDKRKEANYRKKRDAKILELYEAGLKQEEIKEKLIEDGFEPIERSRIAQIVSEGKVSSTNNLTKNDFSENLHAFNVWEFPQPSTEYGNCHRWGNVDPQILEHILYYFTEPGDLVVDPMAGQGLAAEVCERYNRRCLMYDIAPVNHRVTKNDILAGLPPEAQNCDHLFLDPPYFNLKVKGAFNDDPETFYTFIRQIAYIVLHTVKPGGHVFFVMCDKTKGEFEPLSPRCYRIWEDAGAEPAAIVSIPLPPPHNPKAGAQIANARRQRKLNGRRRTLYVFRRPV